MFAHKILSSNEKLTALLICIIFTNLITSTLSLTTFLVMKKLYYFQISNVDSLTHSIAGKKIS